MPVTAPQPGSVAASEADEDEDEDEEMEEVKEEHTSHASARYARLSARRMHRLLIMAASSCHSAAVSLNTMARAAALIADAFAEEAGVARVGPY